MLSDASTRRKHQTQAPDASSNGGDASHVGYFSAASGRVSVKSQTPNSNLNLTQ